MNKTERFKDFVEKYSTAYLNSLAKQSNHVVPVELLDIMKDVFADGMMHAYGIGSKWPDVYNKLNEAIEKQKEE